MPLTIILNDASTAAGIPRSLYRRKLMKRLGASGVYTTTAVATGGEARRQVIVSRLVDDEMPLEALAGRHLYVATGDEAGHQTRVLSVGTHGPLGMLEFASPTVAPVASGVEIELSASLPAESYGEWPCLNDLVNEGLDALTIDLDHDFSYVLQQVRYDLSSLVWKTFRRESVLDVYRPIPSGGTAAQTLARPINRALWSVEYDGERPYLQLRPSFEDGETFYVRMRRPASSWVLNATWGDSTTGLTDDTHEAVYDVDSVVNVALPMACERLRDYWLEQADQKQDAGDEAGAVVCARRAKRWTDKGNEAAGAAALTRFHKSFRGTGVQRVSAIGGR